ncbi:MAG TPA: hypothetical protein VLM85_29545, partial [Polyangiaceae bacterium]|nr:hypothetical protein [Polyangiaceae bacterium]
MRFQSIVAVAIACTLQVAAGTGCKRRPHVAAAGPPAIAATMPAGYVETHVLRVVAMHSGGNAVLLTDSAELVALPIFIGGTE